MRTMQRRNTIRSWSRVGDNVKAWCSILRSATPSIDSDQQSNWQKALSRGRVQSRVAKNKFFKIKEIQVKNQRNTCNKIIEIHLKDQQSNWQKALSRGRGQSTVAKHVTKKLVPLEAHILLHSPFSVSWECLFRPSSICHSKYFIDESSSQYVVTT